MTEIKRYVPANDDRGEGTVVRNDQSGTVVFYDDHAAIVAALQEQVRALAAENAALKNANRIANNILNDEETMITSLWESSLQMFSSQPQPLTLFSVRFALVVQWHVVYIFGNGTTIRLKNALMNSQHPSAQESSHEYTPV